MRRILRSTVTGKALASWIRRHRWQVCLRCRRPLAHITDQGKTSGLPWFIFFVRRDIDGRSEWRSLSNGCFLNHPRQSRAAVRKRSTLRQYITFSPPIANISTDQAKVDSHSSYGDKKAGLPLPTSQSRPLVLVAYAVILAYSLYYTSSQSEFSHR